MKKLLNFVSIFMIFAIPALASERNIERHYVIFQAANGKMGLGTADRFLTERAYLGGPFSSYRWAIQPLHITNCSNLKVLPGQGRKTRAGNTILIRPVTCKFSLPQFKFSSTPEIGYLVENRLNGKLEDGSEVHFWIFNSGWRTHFIDSTVENQSGKRSVDLFFQ